MAVPLLEPVAGPEGITVLTIGKSAACSAATMAPTCDVVEIGGDPVLRGWSADCGVCASVRFLLRIAVTTADNLFEC